MQNKDLVLGIDTSNYTTSLAITDINGTILADRRKLLTVKQGERGLRQSHALFQHMENLPELFLMILEMTDKTQIGAVAASSRPRPVEGSYMPVFKAGECVARSIAAASGIPIYETSHQEGHISAACYSTEFIEREFIAFHLSGGTSEILHVKKAHINVSFSFI
jgi:N6-L-threonylcarbamoyladenine synthase